MNVFTAIKGRRSIREFTDQMVAKEILLKLLEAAVWSPSGGNAQTWHFVAITDQEKMKKIKMLSPGLSRGAPAVIVIAQDLSLAKHIGGEMGSETISKMDSAMAAQNIMLAAYEMGLGTCAVASFHQNAVGKFLKFPEHIKPQLLVSVGHPAKNPSPPARKFEEVIWFEEYDG